MEFENFSAPSLTDEKITFYKKLLFQIPDFIFVMKILPTGTMQFPFISRSAFEYFKISESEYTDDPREIISRRIAPEESEAIFNSISISQLGVIPWSQEFSILQNDKRRWVRGHANVELESDGCVIFYGRLADITAHRIQQNELKISEERYQFAMEASIKGVWDLDLRTKKVFYSSQSMAMLQFGAEDYIDSQNTWDNRIHPEDKANYERVIQSHLDNETPYYENAKRMIALDGSIKWILSRGKVIEREPSGKALRLIGTHTDITMQKQREQELAKTMEIISEQNGRLLNFAHIVSHNLRSHAGNLSMLLQIMEMDEDAVAKIEGFSHLKSTSEALSDTVDHLKELVDIQTALVPKKEGLKLNEYLKQVLVILREEVNSKHVTIINNIPADATVSFNAAYLESILLNFTTNAIRYSSPDRIPEITYNFSVQGNSKILEIKDNGLGINMERYGDRLFGMYKTFHKNPASRGLGLFITKNQIESMGGSVEIESEEGKGTIFKIYFNDKEK